MPEKHQQTLGNILAYPNTPPRTQRGPKSCSWIKFWYLEVTLKLWKWPEKSKFLIFFIFLPLFGNQWIWKPVKTTKHIKIPFFGHIQHHNWSLGTDSRLENGHIQPLEWPEKSRFWNFSNFFYFLATSGALWVLGRVLGYAKMFPNVCWCFSGI